MKKYKVDILNVLIACNFTNNRSEGKRLIKQGGVKINDEIVKDFIMDIIGEDDKCEFIIKKGKRHILKLTIKE